MDGSERDSDTTLGSWVSVSGNQEDNVMSLDGSSSSADDDNDNSSSSSDDSNSKKRHERQVDDATPGGEGSTHHDASNHNDGDDNDGGGGGSPSGFVIPTARPLVAEYDAEVPPASGGGTQRRRKGHHHQQQQQQQQQSDHQSQSQHQPTQPPSRMRRRTTHASSILLNPLYVFGTFTVVAYLMRPNSSQMSTPDTDVSIGSKFYDDPWDQGEDFRDRSPIPDKWKRKQARTEKALAAAKRKKMEEEEEARRKNATGSADEDEDEVEVVEVSVDENEEEEIVDGEQRDKQEESSGEETTGARNETKSETKANVTNATSFEKMVDPFPQLYDWQNWTTRLVNETSSETFATDPIFLWFAPQSGGGAFVKILEDCYEGINITRSQWWRYETPGDADATDSANAGGNSWWWQHDTAPLDDTSPTEDGRLPIMATTNLLEAASSAFNSSAGRGRCISLFMHPIERAIRSYHHHRMIYSRTAKRNASATSNSTSNITLESYAQGPFAEENRLVRSIANRNTSEALRWEDLEVTMDFVTRKCLVGIIGDKRNLLIRTVALIEMALGLTKRERNSSRCTAERIDEWADSMHEISNQRIDLPSEDTEAWGALMRKNAYDMKLYEKVTELFANQTTLLNETRAARSKVKSTALNQDGKTDKDTAPATEKKRTPDTLSTNATDALDDLALDNSRVDEEVNDKIEEEEEEEERADDDEENIDDDEIEETGEGDIMGGKLTGVEDSNVN